MIIFQIKKDKKLKFSLDYCDCAKFRGSSAIVGLMGLKLSYHCAFVGPKSVLVGIPRVRNFFSWVFCGLKAFSRGYFVGPKFFSCGYFLGPTFCLVDILWVTREHIKNIYIQIKMKTVSNVSTQPL